MLSVSKAPIELQKALKTLLEYSGTPVNAVNWFQRQGLKAKRPLSEAQFPIHLYGKSINSFLDKIITKVINFSQILPIHSTFDQ